MHPYYSKGLNFWLAPHEQRYWQNRESANIGLVSSVGRAPARPNPEVWGSNPALVNFSLFIQNLTLQNTVYHYLTRRKTKHFINPNPLGCVQSCIQIGGFGTVRVKGERIVTIGADFLQGMESKSEFKMNTVIENCWLIFAAATVIWRKSTMY